MSTSFANLPDPRTQAEFYSDVTIKRFVAWVFDAILISILTFLVVLFTAFTAILIIGFVSLVI